MAASDFIASGALLLSLVSLLYTLVQVHRAQIAQRAALFKELYQKLFDDDDINYIYSLTEKEERIFPPGFGAFDEQERGRRQRGIERLFAHLEIICAMYKSKMLAPEDLDHFDFNIRRLSQYPGFDKYRHFLEEQWPRKRGLQRGPYSSLFWYLDETPPIVKGAQEHEV